MSFSLRPSTCLLASGRTSFPSIARTTPISGASWRMLAADERAGAPRNPLGNLASDLPRERGALETARMCRRRRPLAWSIAPSALRMVSGWKLP